MNSFIDLRSDTVTKPSAEMLLAMGNADVGDDVYGEDPTVNELQAYAAQLFGKEAALFCSSGTQTNQIAINVHVQPGGEVICHKEAHIYKYEGGGIAKNSGASVQLIDGNFGRLTAQQVADAIQPNDIHFPITQLIALEDTANRGGGAIYDVEEIKNIKKIADKHAIPMHLDGARLFNALVETKINPQVYGAQFDSISICLSKGLGAPIGSLLLGTTAFIEKARRVRKVMGGGMRQAGFIAAAGLYALKNNVERLTIDHQHALQIDAILAKCSWVKNTYPVQTNIIVIELVENDKRDLVLQQLKENQVLASAFGPGKVRFVFHLDVSAQQVAELATILPKISV
jgi:threonine aldolase|uniref:low-specificity L-threonine aldolase n=1 Tax=Fluviicola sp. TaxID=1917219 RepID=UPI00404ACB9D